MACPVQKVRNYFEVPVKKRPKVVDGSQKYDGQFAYLRAGVGYSRTGKEYPSLLPLARTAYAYWPEHVICIEFMVNDAAGKPLPVNEISGYFRRGEECPLAYAVVHDVLPIEDFDAGLCLRPWHIRDRDCYAMARPMSRFMYNPQTRMAGDEDSCIEFANKFIDKGLEGACFKDPGGTWQANKKDYRQTKIKGEVSYDLQVVDVEVGRPGTKYEDTLGKLVCRWTDGRVVRCSGMSDEQRRLWWDDPRTIIGEIVKVDGMCLTPDGMIREPRFKEVRHDKEQADV